MWENEEGTNSALKHHKNNFYRQDPQRLMLNFKKK